MGSNYRMDYGVDIVFVIDVTMSMKPLLDTVKENVLHFYQDFVQKMNEKKKIVSKLRVRVVAFRDYYYDREDAMLLTNFFELPADAAKLEAAVKSLQPEGGGDDPEDGLEALAFAMKSDWNMDAPKKRHVIVVWTDDGTHDLGFGSSVPNYPNGMPKDFNELTEWWGTRNSVNPVMNNEAKRLLLFTPDKGSWGLIRDNWGNVVQFVSEAGNGLEHETYEHILNAIAGSI